jgi:serine/threonine-protein kinase
VALDSSRVDAHRVLASALFIRKHFAEAYLEFRTASVLEPTDDDMWYRWGRASQRLGDADRERRIYEAAIERRPHCFKPWWWLASWQYRNGHVDAAERCFREMIRRSPTFFNGYASLGGLLLLRGEYARAIDTLHLAVSLNPSSSAYNNLGTAYFNSGRLTDALDAYNQAFQFGDTDYVTWLNLGDAYFWLRNRPDDARGAYRQAMRVGREQMASRAQGGHAPDPMIPALLAAALPKLGEPDSARAMLREALAIDSLNSRVQYQAALTSWQLGSRDEAIAWLRKAVAGGYPVVWLRDSPVHRDWRDDPGFQALLASAAPTGVPGSPARGGTK